jgi:hypothetical protein
MSKFWDADDLLMSQEQVISIAEKDLQGLIFGNKCEIGNFEEEQNITKEGHKLEAPLWFALVLRNESFVTINNPKFLTDKFYHMLQADPTIVNFKNKSLHFYEICLKLIPFLDEEDKWPRILAETIQKRFLNFMKNAANVKYENYNLTKLVCLREKKYYDKQVKINKNVKFFLENYQNNNKSLEDIIFAKKISKKTKKIK